MIRIKDLSVTYNPDKTGWILKDVNLTAHPGECILICGASGCGKTSLTRAVNGLIPHFEKGWRAGRVLVNYPDSYRDVKDFKPYELARIMGSVFQDPRSQFFTTRVDDEVAWGCENLQFEREKTSERLNLAISGFGLAGLGTRDIFHAYPVDTGWNCGVWFRACQITPGLCWSSSIFSLMKLPVLAIWNVFGGQTVSNAQPVVRRVTLGVFRPDHACWNAVNADIKLALQQVRSCIERGNHYQSGFGLRIW